MSTSTPLTRTQWLIIIVAAIGFLFDTYELLMTPLIGPSAIAELKNVPLNHPLVTEWMGKMLWITAVCGGVFGLLGGWLIDRFGRKRIMAASIFVYAFSPCAAAYSQSLEAFIFFRSTTFVGVCVEFIAAITWLAEVFEDRRQREKYVGITQAFASLGGVAVTAVGAWVLAHSMNFPAMGLPVALGAAGPGSWRYQLLTGFLPAIPIALLLPFVPESKIWREKRAAGTLRRASFGAIFAPELRRVTLVTTVLSACAYAIAFGALQVTVSQAVPGLPELASQATQLTPLRKAGTELSLKIAAAKDPVEKKKLITDLKANVALQKPLADQVQEVRNHVQLFQEMGGLFGRIALAVLLIVGLSRRTTLRVFQFPSLVVLPLTYFLLFQKGGNSFFWAYGLCGFLTVAQFSYFGEYLPKVFPLHLRGTGGSFATNVGGRMIGTSASLLTTNILAPMLAGGVALMRPAHVAQAAGYLAGAVALIAVIVAFFLPEPKLTDAEVEGEGAKAASQNPGSIPPA